MAGGKRVSLKGTLPFLGPAFIAAVAYIDPGNFATNIQAGSQFGYMLLWVVLSSNLIAVLLQTLSAKLGIATGKNLPELCRAYLPKRASMGLWVFAEVGAMATDLAEFLGASVGFYLLCMCRSCSRGCSPVSARSRFWDWNATASARWRR